MSQGLVENYTDILKSEPDSKRLEHVLTNIIDISRNSVEDLRVIMTLLDFTVPQIYSVATKSTKQCIITILQSITGISGIINKIRYGLRVGGNLETLKIYGIVLNDIFNDDLLVNLNAATGLKINEINKLLFKGQCFSIFTELNGTVQVKSPTMDDNNKYISFLVQQLLKSTSLNSEVFNKYLLSLISFSQSRDVIIFDMLFVQSHWPTIVRQEATMKQFQKKSFALFIINCIAKRFKHLHNIGAMATLIKPILNKEMFDGQFLEKLLRLQNRLINSLIVVILDRLDIITSTFQILLKVWGDSVSIKTEPISLQSCRTHLLVQMLYYGGKEFCSNLLTSPNFIDSISNRLNSYSNSVKIFGIILSDKVCELAQQDKIFSLEDLDGYEYLLNDSSYYYHNEIFSTSEAFSEISAGIIEEPEELKELDIKELKISKPAENSDDESEDSDDDDTSVASRIKLPPPIYIKELIRYLQIDTNHPQAYDMRRLALTTGPTLIRQKSQFGIELKSNSFSLLETLIGLSDHYQESDFEELRLNNIIALLVSHPPSGLDIIQLLDSGDFSLQQRIIILTAISLAARDIRGFKDEKVTKSYKEQQFASKSLPPQLHQKYLQMEAVKNLKVLEFEKLQSIHHQIQDSLMMEESEKAKDKIAGGKILRISKRLTNTSQHNNDVLIPRYNDYSKIISKNFYFPLTHLWHEIGGIDIGPYSAIFIGHYIKTLSLLLHCSISVLNKSDMIREFLIIVYETSKNVKSDELQIIEGIVTGLLIVCDIYDEQHLIINFGETMVHLHQFISEMWELIIDDKVKSLCAGFLIRFTNIMEKYQGNLVDQMNNIY